MTQKTMKNGDVVVILPLTAEVLDRGEADYFVCLTCDKTYQFYSNTCCGEAVSPARVFTKGKTAPEHSEYTV